MLRRILPAAADPFGYRALLSLALPLAATVGCFSVTLFTDRTLLMWYGPTSSAASISAGNLYWAIACIPVTALGFLTPLVATAIGDRRSRGPSDPRVWSLLWQSVWITAAAIPIFGLVAFYSRNLFEAFDHPPELAIEEARYFRTLLLVAPASMLEAGLTAFFVGQRITRPIFRTNVLSAVANVVLDVWFIFGGLGLPAMGVFGAALATAAAMWLKILIFTVLLLMARPSGSLHRGIWKPRSKLIGEILIPGSTLGIQQLIRSGLFSFVLLTIGAASITGLAATSAALSLYQLISIPAIGLATAITVVVGQSVSADRGRQVPLVVRRSMVITLAAAGAIAAALFVFPGLLVQIPLHGVSDAERVRIEPTAITLLKFAACYAVFDICSLALASINKGLGRTVPILIATGASGAIAVGWGWLAAPSGELAVRYWWYVLLAWSITQCVLLLIPLQSTLSQRRRRGQKLVAG